MSRRLPARVAALLSGAALAATAVAQQPAGSVSSLARTACAAAVHCPPAWTSRGITPAKVRVVLGLGQAAARQRLLETSALWSDDIWRCAALGKGCPAGTTQRSAQIMIPLPPDALRAVQQVLAGDTPAPMAAASAATPAPAAANANRPAQDAGAAQDQGSAACFNPDLFRAGTQYRHHTMAPGSRGQPVHVIREITIGDNGSFAGASGLIVEHGTSELTSTPGTGTPNIATDYYSLEQTPDGPVYYRHEWILRHESTAMGGRPATESESIYTPPVRMGEFAMQPGQSYRFVGSATSMTREPGQPPSPPESKPDSQVRDVTYVGRKQVRAEAGTFDTCHFVVDGSDHHYIVGMGFPLVRGKTELQPDSHINGVPVNAWAR